jgi:hypothetical protein
LEDGKNVMVEEFFSVLIKSVEKEGGGHEIKEVFRVKLPGNPVLGVSYHYISTLTATITHNTQYPYHCNGMVRYVGG